VQIGSLLSMLQENLTVPSVMDEAPQAFLDYLTLQDEDLN